MSLNITIISGNLTKDPDIRTTASGTTWATFSVAVNERRKNGDVWEDVPTYFDCKGFDRVANYIVRCDLGKGSKVVAKGRMVQEEYKAKDGELRRAWRLLVDDIEPMARGSRAAGTGEPATVEAVYEESLPF